METMIWGAERFTNAEIDRAGEQLRASSGPDTTPQEALSVINRWRSSHSFPLNTFQMTLRRYAALVSESHLVAQRSKRLTSIRAKLVRFRTMNLSQMQDVGGCRAVVHDIDDVLVLRAGYNISGIKHEFVREDNYINNPKPSGYRGIHLIYRYHSDRKTTYNGLQLELQLRSRLQHAWATAVETVGVFLRQSLKASEGHGTWLRFFCLMGSALALREGKTLVPGTPATKTALTKELRAITRQLDVRKRLRTYGDALQTLQQTNQKDSRYFLMFLQPSEEKLSLYGYRAAELELATANYLKIEEALDGAAGEEAVLVAAGPIDSLRRAYPNYFLDTDVFLKAVADAIK